MAHNVLAALVAAGIVERAGGRRPSHLRVTPRFLAHAEGTEGRLRLQQGATEPLDTLEEALSSWDEYRNDRHAGARFLDQLLDDRSQWGILRPAFPELGSFQATAPMAA